MRPQSLEIRPKSGHNFFEQTRNISTVMTNSYEKILKDLFRSKGFGNVVALKVKGNEKTVLTSVEDVKGNRIVVLNPISVYGMPIHESVLHLEDIESIRVYNARYTDPIYVRIRELKDNIDQIRRNLRW